MDGSDNPIYAAIPYEVVYDELFEQEFAKIEPDPIARDNRLVGIEFIIARIPTKLDRVRGSNLYRLIHDGVPALRIWYTFDGTIVRMRYVERLPEPTLYLDF